MFRSYRRRSMLKRRRIRVFGSMRCTTSCIESTYCNTPMPAARPIRVWPAWTKSGSRTSRRTAWIDGSGNWRGNSERRGFIPKRSGQGRRPLGIPSIRDRTVQMAAVLVLGPIFEADLQPEQHAYRPERNALTAVKQVHHLLNTGHAQIIDADLAAYFDSIPHVELLKSVARRVVDRAMLHLIKMWLQA